MKKMGTSIISTDRNRKQVFCVFAIALLVSLVFLACFAAADVPLGSMVIYGLNGTEMTGSRNVLLNLSYSSGDGIGVCRWANDGPVDLTSAPWEDCTTVKAWLLSQGYGNKTVYFQIRDLNGDNATFNDSIMYRSMQDYTAPTPPVVYDGLSGDDIDWWNDNTTLRAHWFNATEDISTIYYKYRILNDSSCYNDDCNWTDIGTDTDVTVGSLILMEGKNLSFEVMAYNPFGLNSTAISNGTVIDITEPDRPGINSSTHPLQTKPYDESTAVFNFSATDPAGGGVSSGIQGYSYLLDTHPGTAPDRTMEERYWETLAEMHKGGYNQTLKVNGSGAADYAYAVFSQLHTNITENDSIRVRVALAEQSSDYSDLMGVEVYLAKAGGEGVAVSSFDMEASAVSSIENVSWDIRYAEDMTLARVYQFDLTVNETVDDNTDDIYVVVAGLIDDDNNRNPLAIAGTTTLALVDNTTKNYVCDETDACSENTNTLDYAIEVERQDSGGSWTVQYDYLGDRTYYFHVKAKDVAGNWGDTEHYRIIVAAGGVSSIIYSPVDGEFVTAEGSEANVTVKVSVSGNASVYVIAEHPDGSDYTSAQAVFDDSHEFEDITLELGQNEIYAVTNTTTGAVAHSPSIHVTVSAEFQPPTDKTLRIKYTGCVAAPLPYICNRDEGASYVGIATENSGSVSAPDIQTDTSINSLKIYMTRPFDLDTIAGQFNQNIFLDRVNPMFGYAKRASRYVIRDELRYYDIYLGGSFFIPPGTYQLYLRKTGIATDGRYNITLELE